MKQIIVNCAYWETRVAVMENRKLIELFVERPEEQRIVGHIYKGKVANVLPGMQAAFIDIGLEKNAFIYVDDCLPSEWKDKDDRPKPSIREVLTQGQEILVQVVKEPLGTKGARVTTQLSFPGRYLVFMPSDPYIGLSRKISQDGERERLRLLLKEQCKEQEGVIVRTVAEGASEEELIADLEFLRGLWRKTIASAKESKPMRVVHKDLDLVSRITRDVFSEDVDELIIDSQPEYHKLLEDLGYFIPTLKPKLKLYTDRTGIFDSFEVEAEIEKALKRKVWLKSGGYIIIDQTEAFTSIDVNTGKFTGTHQLEETVYKTNLEATKEIARQLRLRDIGGIILIDFIDMRKSEHRDHVWHALQEHLKRDRTKSHLLGFTQLGLLEMTRKKVRQNLSDVMTRPCPYCEGKGKILSLDTVSSRIEREIKEYARSTHVESILIEVHPCLADKFEGERGEERDRIQRETGLEIHVHRNENMHEQHHHLFVGSQQEVRRKVAMLDGKDLP
ncbi:Rne/Rng family ribonuclease [Ammoniphilus sp. CFH 90114]|uniref:Rne/Rng family ribonuclease n=1 Tax=Ammoniphilus sp. CFH 90114 TaxID=2493665 RepID=UPI00100E1AFC|nr:Rne/Rng family ribonuclease [Ammoniphilus sp. CFH 90114]RXT14728.1 Rne/Rng family ribonuclease [Ammoniphilus sp. CFH 90114]